MSTSMHPYGVFRLITAAAAAVLIASGCGEDTPPTGTNPPQNQAPVAQAGPDQIVSAGIEVSLDGVASTDGDGDALTYMWSIASIPAGSTATLSDASAARTTFLPDLPGAYSVQLVVSDGTDDSTADVVAITAEDNTVTETIGAAGGAVASSDGSFNLVVPAGALTEAVGIQVTPISPSQFPSELDGLDPADLVVYDLQPSGLQFATPATVTLTLPDAATENDSGFGLGAGLAFTLFDGANGLEAEVLDNVTLGVTRGGSDVTLSGSIDHFSTVAKLGRMVEVRAEGVPPSIQVGTSFDVTVYAQVFERREDDTWLQGAQMQTDVSGPLVAPEPGFSGTFTPNGDFVLTAWSGNPYACGETGTGTYRAHVDVTYAWDLPDETGIAELDLFAPDALVLDSRATLEAEIECVPPPAPPPGTFTTVESAFAEMVALVALASVGDVYGVAGDAGLKLFDADGSILREVSRPSSPEELWGVLGSTSLSGEGPLFGFGSAGIYVPDPSQLDMLMHLNLDANTGSVTDGIRINFPIEFVEGPARSSHSVDEQFAFAQFEERNILFVQSDGAGGWEVVPELAEAFVQNGVSIFGDDRPISLWIGPNGFDEDNPMLVLTIDDNTFGDLNVVRLENGVAVRTIVPDFTSIIAPRRLRCDDATGVCGMSSFRTSTFGGIYTFRWDGQGGVTRLSPRLGFAPVGIDVVSTGSSVLMTGTDTERFVDGAFQYEFRVLEYSLTGALQRSAAFRLPDDCIDPFHAFFRRRVPGYAEVLVSCKGDDQNGGRVIAVPWAWPSS